MVSRNVNKCQSVAMGIGGTPKIWTTPTSIFGRGHSKYRNMLACCSACKKKAYPWV